MATPDTAAPGTPYKPKLVAGQVALANTETTIYTVPANKAAKINVAGSLANVSPTVDVQVGLGIVPSVGAADGTHKAIPNGKLVTVGNSIPLADFIGGHILGEGDFISVWANTAAVIDYVISVMEIG